MKTRFGDLCDRDQAALRDQLPGQYISNNDRVIVSPSSKDRVVHNKPSGCVIVAEGSVIVKVRGKGFQNGPSVYYIHPERIYNLH